MRFRAATALAALALSQASEPALAEPGVRCILEQDCLDLLMDRVYRSGDTLRVTVADGTVRSYRDVGCAPEGGDCAAYRIAAYLPDSGVYLVEVEDRDSLATILVDAADGTEGRLFATPVFSPSGQRLVVTANGFAGHGHEIATWDRRDGHWAEGGRFGGGAGRPVEEWTFRGWEGEDLIRFDYALVDPPGQPGKVEMRWDGGGWQVIQRPPVTSSGLQQGGAGGQ